MDPQGFSAEEVLAAKTAFMLDSTTIVNLPQSGEMRDYMLRATQDGPNVIVIAIGRNGDVRRFQLTITAVTAEVLA